MAPPEFPPISEQLRSYQHRTGDSLHRASDRSVVSGRRVTQKYLWTLERGQAGQWPRNPQTFEAIATAIETTPLAVVLGFASEFGVPVRMPEFASRLPPRIDDLDERVKESILAVLWTLCTDAPARRYLPGDAVLSESDIDAPNVISGPSKDEPGSSGQQ